MADNGLNIFKASAGSGKTFRLVGEYLKMLFARPMSYKNILAVTFTNKATAEMKERILSELANLSKGDKSKYLEFLQEYGSEPIIRQKATRILKLILHDYSRFSVMTIDSFFQKVIRSFAREIRLNASFKTEIDNRQALEDAVDLLFQEIDSNELLMGWMVQFLEENLEEGRSWDFKKELLKYGKEVEKEAFKVHGDEFLEMLAGKEQLTSYVSGMKKVLLDAEIRLKKMGQEGLDLIAHAGMSYDQLKNGKSSFANHFNKLVNGKFEPPTQTTLDARDNLESWSKKTDSPQVKAQIENLYRLGLNRNLVESIDALLEEIPRINSAQAIIKNIYPFGLLGNIALKIKEVLKENNTVLLSDSGQLIGKIIEGNDTPFIYEKVGTIYHHFMLDEFQDTSRQQWTNFRPLIENALASGNSSLVVGDVKQSIYRWRNGDWNLLANQLASDLAHQTVSTHTLDTNWRSQKNIVDFNNRLFWSASGYLNNWFESETKDQALAELNGVIAQAYADQYEKSSLTGKPEGYVKISFVDTENSRNKNDFREKALALLVEQIETVQQSGVKAEEITILVRENAEAERVAKALWGRKKTDAQPGCSYDVITSDTLKIGTSPVVRFVVNFFRIFAGKDPRMIRAEILYGYYRILQPLMGADGKEQPIELHDLFDAGSPLPELFEKWLDTESRSEFHTGLLALPLYELAVTIADHFRLGTITGEKVYLQAFLDMVLEYGREASGGIAGFLEWWEASGSNKTLNLPTVRNFIRISSIHQSKGLEYHTVFVPFCNWEIALNSHKVPYIWLVPESEPFNQLKMVLLKCDSSLKNSIFSQDYYREMLFSIMDNLNLLYVAMTRAINNLLVIMPYKEGIKQVGTVAELMQDLLESPVLLDSIDQEKYLDFGKNWDPVNKIYELGSLMSSPSPRLPLSLSLPLPVSPSPRPLVPSSPRPLVPPSPCLPLSPSPPPSFSPQNDPLILNSNSNRLEIRLHSKDYFQLTGNLRTERINKGTMMHQLFEKIRTRVDVGPAVHNMVTAGQLTSPEGKELFEKIDALLQVAPFSEWFGGRWRVLNERDILRPGETKHRPDRVLLKDNSAVVIDYKTGEKSDKDIRQMKGYLGDLQKMGYHSCEGNIWYLQKNEVVKVDSLPLASANGEINREGIGL
ncbi:MAG: UvrD-helicase domain-containing protein [Bacteroidetes bacterium]|nr:UvrD-helicase domain-containing protein [Bacteroidota bacterium]